MTMASSRSKPRIMGDRSRQGWLALIILSFGLVMIALFSVGLGASDLTPGKLFGLAWDWLANEPVELSRRNSVIRPDSQ